MANAEHLKILKEGVERWNRWREENENVLPDLIGADLSYAELSNVIPIGPPKFGMDCFDAVLVGINLSRSNLSGTNFSHANLIKANLSHTDLSSAILSDTDLFEANLFATHLADADLTDANLDSAILSYANLSNADLSNAKLNFANLFNTNLLSANLANTSLNSAIVGRTIFGLTDLSRCKNLETTLVAYPCTIDYQTLRASRNLSQTFLQKIGLPESYIANIDSLSFDAKYYPAFLSHSHANKPFARKLYEALIARGVNVFFDEKKMKPGDDIFTSISRGIELYDKTILVCSEDSLNSWWVDQELELVFEKERKLQKETGEKTGLLIPIRIDDHIDTWNSGKRMAIKQRIIGDFRNWEDEAAFEQALTNLIHALNADRPEINPVSHLKRNT